jgi:hypothetical protein
MSMTWRRYTAGAPRTTNPFRAWLEKQPPEITMVTIARQLGVTRAYVGLLMAEGSIRMPSLNIIAKIEAVTDGAVTAKRLANYAARNGRKP